MTNKLIEINLSENKKISIPVIEYQGKKVITTELLAQLYGTDTNNIRKNFERNKERFQINIHFYKLTGAELSEFIKQYNSSTYISHMTNSHTAISVNTRILYLWTEEGCIRHAKILETDQAWNVFTMLEKFYFQHKKASFEIQSSDAEMKCRMAIEVAKATSELLRLSDTSKLRMMYKICEIYQVDTKFLPFYVDQNATGSLTQLLEDFNLTHLGSARKINLILEALGIIEKITRKSTSSPTGQKQFWSLTSKGLEFGKNESSAQNPRETQPHYFRESFLKLINIIQNDEKTILRHNKV